MGQAHLTGLGVEDFDPDPATHCLVGDDPCIGIEIVHCLRRRAEQRLVDRVLALDRQHRHAAETQLFVEADRGGVIVRHRQVHVGAARTAEVLRQGPGEGLTDAGESGGGIDGQGPQARPLLGIGEQQLVIDAGDGAHHGTVLVAHRQQIFHCRHVQMIFPDHVGPRRDHPAPHVHAVHVIGIVRALQRAHGHPERRRRQAFLFRRIGEAQPIGMAGVDEKLGRRFGDHDVRLTRIDADVAAPGSFPAQRLDQLPSIGEGLTEDESAPAQFELDVLGHHVHQVRRRSVVQAERDRLRVVPGGTASGHATGPVTPWRCSQSSSRAICQSSLPRSGVSLPLGSASRASTASARNSPRSLAIGAYRASRTRSR